MRHQAILHEYKKQPKPARRKKGAKASEKQRQAILLHKAMMDR